MNRNKRISLLQNLAIRQTKRYVAGAQKNRFTKTILLSTDNIVFEGEIIL